MLGRLPRVRREPPGGSLLHPRPVPGHSARPGGSSLGWGRPVWPVQPRGLTSPGWLGNLGRRGCHGAAPFCFLSSSADLLCAPSTLPAGDVSSSHWGHCRRQKRTSVASHAASNRPGRGPTGSALALHATLSRPVSALHRPNPSPLFPLLHAHFFPPSTWPFPSAYKLAVSHLKKNKKTKNFNWLKICHGVVFSVAWNGKMTPVYLVIPDSKEANKDDMGLCQSPLAKDRTIWTSVSIMALDLNIPNNV